MRYTRKDVQACFKRLCALLNKPIATRWNDVGTWDLDYNPTYGGWVVTEVSNTGGGISHPLGDGRVGPREFCERVWFAERVLQAAGWHAFHPRATAESANGRALERHEQNPSCSECGRTEAQHKQVRA